MKLWRRTCQECGLEQFTPKPPGPLTYSYQNRKCKKCKSEALNYGTEYETDPEIRKREYEDWMKSENEL